jgi:hypothetical protein
MAPHAAQDAAQAKRGPGTTLRVESKMVPPAGSLTGGRIRCMREVSNATNLRSNSAMMVGMDVDQVVVLPGNGLCVTTIEWLQSDCISHACRLAGLLRTCLP